MALPFILGLVAGAGAAVAFNNKSEIKDVAQKSFEKGKEVAGDIKQTAKSTVECVKEKMSKEEEEPKKSTRKTATKKTTTRKRTVKKPEPKETDAD